jgi:hypothetical protein
MSNSGLPWPSYKCRVYVFLSGVEPGPEGRRSVLSSIGKFTQVRLIVVVLGLSSFVFEYESPKRRRRWRRNLPKFRNHLKSERNAIIVEVFIWIINFCLISHWNHVHYCSCFVQFRCTAPDQLTCYKLLLVCRSRRTRKTDYLCYFHRSESL